MFGRYSPPMSQLMMDASLHDVSLHDNSSRSQKQQTKLTATAKRYKYLRRILHFRQMDFEYAFWQMLYLFIAPQKVWVNKLLDGWYGIKTWFNNLQYCYSSCWLTKWYYPCCKNTYDVFSGTETLHIANVSAMFFLLIFHSFFILTFINSWI